MDKLNFFCFPTFWVEFGANFHSPEIFNLYAFQDQSIHYGTFSGQVIFHSGKLKIRLLVRMGKLYTRASIHCTPLIEPGLGN